MLEREEREEGEVERRCSVESLLGVFVERVGSGELPSIEELQERHPGLSEGELEQFHATWKEVKRVLCDLREGSSSAPGGEAKGMEASIGSEAIPLLERLASRASRFADYRVEKEIGRGGMGEVLRVRDEVVGRSLALKRMRARIPTRSGEADFPRVARFLEEAQVLGQLDHPGIVPLHELGLDPSGQPYFTMKRVQGRTLAEVFELVREGQEGWTLVRALTVLQRVCEAMAYAHGRGVIHRDLKPHNVMVGDFGEVYVMDWGLARIVGKADGAEHLASSTGAPSNLHTARSAERAHERDSPFFTQEGHVVGTASYMSPEQAAGRHGEVGPHSDVYALGAMLYQLLAGTAPYQGHGRRLSSMQIVDRILAGAPAPLEEIGRGAPAELVAIASKAMAREPEQRYAGMQALAADLAAFVEGRVVAAYETGAWPELKKWVARNRPLALAVAVAALVLVVGSATSWVLYGRAERARAAEAEKTAQAKTSASLAESRREEAERERSRALEEQRKAEKSAKETRIAADFQASILSELSVDEFGHALIVELREDLGANLARIGRTPEEVEQGLAQFDEMVRSANATNVAQRVLEAQVFRPAVEKLDREYAENPLLAALLQIPLAMTLRELGLYDLGSRTAAAAVAARRAGLGDDHPDTLGAIHDLARVLHVQGRHSEAEALYREALAGRRAKLGDEDFDTLASIHNLANLLNAQGKLSEAEPLCRAALAGCRAQFGDEHPYTLTAIHDLANLLYAQGRFSEAELFYREALAGSRAKSGDEHPDTLASMHSLAVVLQDEGKLSEAEPLCRQVLASRRAKRGDAHPDTLRSMHSLAMMLHARGELSEAEPLLREALAGKRAKLGDDHPDTVKSIHALAVVLQVQGRLAEAEPLGREALASRRARLGDEHPDTVNSINNLAVLLHTQGRLSEAEPLCREALARRRARLGDEHPDTLASVHHLAALLHAQDKLSEAEPLCREALAGRRAKLGNVHVDTVRSARGLALTLQARGALDEAEAVLREVLARGREHPGDPPGFLRECEAALEAIESARRGPDPASGSPEVPRKERL